ncbi:MAG: helix-turn-helix transcriptional regulator [Lachnospiraceae bacterium]|nr:helix-turn-helix transcriptional regulator [Lachnospiraceae bacterium]
MTLGERLKSARKSAGLTQEQLSEKLLVSRQAITKWEADRGMPDIENLKQLSRLLNISIDYLLDSGEAIDLSVMREEINLDDYAYTRKLFKGRWSEKAVKLFR